METKKVNEFKAGDKVQGFYLIKSIECRTSSNGKKYLDINICDKSGEINAKYWDYHEGDEEKYLLNNIIKVRGCVNEWQGNLQFRIDKIRCVNEEDGVTLSDYVPSAPYAPCDMYNLILKFIDKIKNSEIKAIVSLVVKDNEDKLMYYPAAKKNHHAVMGGLLYHTTNMLKAGEKMCEIYTFLNTDLLYAGIILHDMAKTREMDSSTLGIVSDYTPEGQLLGHITEGVKLIENAAEKTGASNEVTMLLQHMVLSHHYEPEYGSPVKPMIPEAELLHYLDIIDARLYDMKKASSETEKGKFSERIWSLENRKVYKLRLDE